MLLPVLAKLSIVLVLKHEMVAQAHGHNAAERLDPGIPLWCQHVRIQRLAEREMSAQKQRERDTKACQIEGARSAWLSCVLTTVRASQTNQREDCYAILYGALEFYTARRQRSTSKLDIKRICCPLP